MQEKQNLRSRAFGALLQKSLLSWQVAVTIIFSVLLFVMQPEPFAFWQPWYWLVAGGATAAAFVLLNMTDEQVVQEAMASLFERQYNLAEIQNKVSRERIRDAMEYRRNMLTLAKRANGAMRLQLLQTVDDINDWIEHMVDLAQHIDAFEANVLVGRDRRTVPAQLEKTMIRAQRENDSAVKADLEKQVEQLKQQLANLEATANSVKRAEIQLESTLSSLGTIYAQMSRLGASEVDSGRAQRLRLEIQDEVSSLQDTIEAMNEVQAESLRLR